MTILFLEERGAADSAVACSLDSGVEVDLFVPVVDIAVASARADIDADWFVDDGDDVVGGWGERSDG